MPITAESCKLTTTRARNWEHFQRFNPRRRLTTKSCRWPHFLAVYPQTWNSCQRQLSWIVAIGGWAGRQTLQVPDEFVALSAIARLVPRQVLRCNNGAARGPLILVASGEQEQYPFYHKVHSSTDFLFFATFSRPKPIADPI